MKTTLLFISLLLIGKTSYSQANCANDSTGLIPINDLGTGYYSVNGLQGGLYPNGSNYRPSAHMSTGLSYASQVLPCDTNGIVDTANGKIVMMSIGFSNPSMEFSTFIPLANAFSGVNPKLEFINGAKPTYGTNVIDDPDNSYWDTTYARLVNAGLHPNQVQVIWMKGTYALNNTAPPYTAFTDTLRTQFKKVMHNVMLYFPNVKICYMASRIYGGYDGANQNYEPYAYWNGWVVKSLIEDQINGDTALAVGVRVPWLCWGTYNWADGVNPRSDSLTWQCTDLAADGMHPSVATGRPKVANMLLNFLATDSTSCPWFYANGCDFATGIHDAISKNEIKIFPNPADFSFTITVPDEFKNSEFELMIYNTLGQQIYQKRTSFGASAMEGLSVEFPPGMYNIIIHSNEKTATQKLIIN